MSTWKVILATLVIFTAGIVTGGLLVKNTIKTNKPGEPVRTEVLRRLTRDLDLTPEQRAKVNEAIQESLERTKILREIVDPELRAEYKQAIETIRAQLNPQQKARFDELLKQRRKPGGPGERRRQGSSNSMPVSTQPRVSKEANPAAAP